MVIKVKESFEKTRHIKNNDKFKKDILPGQRNTKYHENFCLIKKSYKNNFIYICLSKNICSSRTILKNI